MFKRLLALVLATITAVLSSLLLPSPARAFTIITITNTSTGGQCTGPVVQGIWDVTSKTCTLTTDLFDVHIQIDSGITLDGNGFTLWSVGRSGEAIALMGKTQVTVKNLRIYSYSTGIRLDGTTDSNILNNEINTVNYGMLIRFGSDRNNIVGNTVLSVLKEPPPKGGGVAIFVLESNDMNFLNNTIDGTSEGGISVMGVSSNFRILGNIIRNIGSAAISVSGSNHILSNNIISLTQHGIGLSGPSIAVVGNTITGYVWTGLTFSGDGARIVGNTFAGAGFPVTKGLHLGAPGNNTVYNNNFTGNGVPATSSGTDSFNQPPPLGGNYWDNFDSPAEGCSDTNSDGFCDAPFGFSGGQDNLPWTTQSGWSALSSPPTADAGVDQTVGTGSVVTLDGTGSSDPDGDALSYEWLQVDGPRVTLTDPNSAAPSFTGPSYPTTLTFLLFVSDGTYESSDMVDIQVVVPLPELWAVEYRWASPAPGYQWAPFPTLFRGWLDVRFENDGLGDAYNVTATITCVPVNVTVADGAVSLGHIPAGGTAWSGDSFTLEVDMTNPQDPNKGIAWRVEYDDSANNHHVVDGVPKFRGEPLNCS